MEQRGPHSTMGPLDTFLFLFAGASSLWLAYLVLMSSLEPNWQISLLVPFWVLVAYLVLPRLHRVVTHLYLPSYFIGRTRTSDGLLGDPVNLALQGDEAQLQAAMTAAGWTRADEVTLRSSVRIITATLTGRPYPEAPVSPLYLFDRRQDFAYQQDVPGRSSQRHHVRFWRCPDGWRLPGGYAVEWVAAGTFDRAVGLSLWTFQVTHRIAQDIDVERDHIVSTLTQANPRAAVHRIRHFATGYHARNGGGDLMVTDGDLPVVDLRDIEADRTVMDPAVTEDSVRRPASTTFSAAAVSLRGLTFLGVAVLLFADPTPTTVVEGGDVPRAAAAAAGGWLAAQAVIEVGLALATYFGRNWARVVLMLACTITILGAFIATLGGGPEPTLSSGLPVVALGILVLLALTSPGSRTFATRGRRTREEPMIAHVAERGVA